MAMQSFKEAQEGDFMPFAVFVGKREYEGYFSNSGVLYFYGRSFSNIFFLYGASIYMIVWRDEKNDTLLYISGYFDKESLIDMAESVK